MNKLTGLFLSAVLLICVQSCSDSTPKEVDIVKEPEDLEKVVNESITELLVYVEAHNGKLNDSITLRQDKSMKKWYEGREHMRTWSKDSTWNPLADSIYGFISRSEYYGLFPKNYHLDELKSSFHQIKTDSTAILNAALWSRADIILTDAFMQLVKDLRLGRLEKDSITTRKDLTISDSTYISLLQRAFAENTLTNIFEEQEPRLRGYQELRHALKNFVDSMDRKPYTYIANYPYKTSADSLAYRQQLQSRLFEGGYISFSDRVADSTEMAEAISNYQIDKELTVDGKAGAMVVQSLNNFDSEKFIKAAINLDRYKLMADSLPLNYLWVNIPAFRMELWDKDTLRLESKVIVGRTATRTPVLTSTLTNFITFPQWTVPYSIIFHEMLPKIQRNVGYLDKQNLMVVDKNDSIIDPTKIDWAKLSKNNFPYLLKQRQGDDNSLGVIKFNFANKYSVYLHDTNSRGLFSRTDRALSHGCVRVQQWKPLSKYLVENDSIKYKPDTLAAWMNRKEKHTVYFSRKTPLFIRYFTCEAANDSIKFYADVYGEDRIIRKKYFESLP